MRRPLQLASVVYHSRLRQFYLLIYNCSLQKSYVQKFSIRQVMVFIPFINYMIRLNQLQAIGERIINSFKN